MSRILLVSLFLAGCLSSPDNERDPRRRRRGGLGEGPFAILRDRVERVALVSEEAIRGAFRWMVATERLLVEPTAAVPVAACLAGEVGPVEGPAVVVLTGRNVAAETVLRILSERA